MSTRSCRTAFEVRLSAYCCPAKSPNSANSCPLVIDFEMRTAEKYCPSLHASSITASSHERCDDGDDKVNAIAREWRGSSTLPTSSCARPRTSHRHPDTQETSISRTTAATARLPLGASSPPLCRRSLLLSGFTAPPRLYGASRFCGGRDGKAPSRSS